MSRGRVGAIVLAAGESRRMGSPKQLLPFRGKPLVLHALENACAVAGGATIVVLGAHADVIRPQLDNSPAHVVVNGDWSSGMGSSIKAGLVTLLRVAPAVSGALFVLGDQPLITSDQLAALVQRYGEMSNRIIATGYNTVVGAPALFPRECFDELLELPDASGARSILQRHHDRLLLVDCSAGALDIDTMADYEALMTGHAG